MPTKGTKNDSDERKAPAADSWVSLKGTLRHWDQPRLLGLLHDLFTTVPEARAVIAGRLLAKQPAAAKKGTLDDLRKQVRKAVRPAKSMWNKSPDMRAARRVGDQYLRATGDADGAVALYVELVEAAMELSFEFAWDDSGFYDSIDRAAQAAENALPDAMDAASLRGLGERLRVLLRHKNFPGWGMDDVVGSLAHVIDARAGALTNSDG